MRFYASCGPKGEDYFARGYQTGEAEASAEAELFRHAMEEDCASSWDPPTHRYYSDAHDRANVMA